MSDPDFKDADPDTPGNQPYVYSSNPAESAKGRLPIGAFTGNFDGDGHTVHNLFIYRENENGIGLPGKISSNGEVRDLGHEDVNITGNNRVGDPVGGNYEGTVRNSYWNTEISGQSTSDGGTGLTIAEMYEQGRYTDRDLTKVWNSPTTKSFPTLRDVGGQ